MMHLRRAGLILVAGLVATAVLFATAVADAQDNAQKEQKKEGKTDPFPFPDIDKLIPPGLDPKQAEEFKKRMEMMREMYRRQIEEMQKRFPGGLPPFPGGGFPGGGFPGGNVPP